MARKKPGDGGGGPNWLDTYSDMVTLLLTFFVMLFAMSTMDSAKWQKLVKAFATNKQATAIIQQSTQTTPVTVSGLDSALGSASGENDGGNSVSSSSSDGKMTFDDLYKYIKGYVDQKGIGGSVEVHKGDGYTFITFQNSIFFNGDSAVLRDEGKGILDYLCDGLGKVSNEIQEVRFYGHTARVDEHKTAQMLAADRTLSSNRANNVLLYVQFKNVVEPKKMVSEGYGEYRPLVPHDGTEATRVKNRRVEIYISKSGSVSKSLDDIYSKINESGKMAINTK